MNTLVEYPILLWVVSSLVVWLAVVLSMDIEEPPDLMHFLTGIIGGAVFTYFVVWG